MKIYDGTLLVLFIVAAAVGAVVFAKEVLHEKDDGPIEEVSEEVVEWATGLDIDFTPMSVEEEESIKRAMQEVVRERERKER